MFGDLNGISPPYCPPEVIEAMALRTGLQVTGDRRDSFSEDESTYDGRSFDIYSLGIIMWECWHQSEPHLTTLGGFTAGGTPCFQASAHSWAEEVLQRTLDGFRPNPASASGPLGEMPLVLIELQTRLWSPDPVDRPSAADIKALLDSERVSLAIDEVHKTWEGKVPSLEELMKSPALPRKHVSRTLQ
jgi:serine/threonine protein kinase